MLIQRQTADTVKTYVLSGFDDLRLGPDLWTTLLEHGDTDVIFLTWQWQRIWWDTYGRGKLLLIVAEREGKIMALAPFFADSGMILFIGSGADSYYLDFLGDISDPVVLDALLQTARECTPEFAGFEFYWVPDRSRTGQLLKESASRLRLSMNELWCLRVPILDLALQPDAARQATQKKSLLRHERGFHRDAPLEISHIHEGDTVLSYLPEYFAQHISRWDAISVQSRFLDARNRQFYERVTRLAAENGWLRFMRIGWQERSIAFHFGFRYRQSYLYYQPSFAIEIAGRSPGEVLLRQLLLAAIAEQADVFDLGPGEQTYKFRFATRIGHVSGYGLYR